MELVKDDVTGEVNLLRESARRNAQRNERLEEVYLQVEARLTSLRTDIARSEEDYSKVLCSMCSCCIEKSRSRARQGN